MEIDVGTTHETHNKFDTDYRREAIYLAEHYGALRKTRDSLKKRLDGSWVFTKDMAIEELISTTANYSGDHVQSSNISDSTARIADRLANGYVEQRQSQIDNEHKQCQREYEYTCWKIGIVETAITEWLGDKEQAVFIKHCGEGWTYRRMQEKFKGGGLSHKAIRKAIVSGTDAIRQHLRIVACLGESDRYIARLMKEV